MLSKEELKQKIIDLSNDVQLSDGQTLDLFFDCADEATFWAVIKVIEKLNIKEKLSRYFAKRGAVLHMYQSELDYDDEWRIKFNKDKEIHIELADRAKAINNELDFIDTIQERNEFLLSIATLADPYEIGAYIRIEPNLYYKEL